MRPGARARRFVKDEQGTVTLFSVLMLVLIILITGAAVDIMRTESVRVATQSAMDRAVLAAADLDQRQDPETVVRDYLVKAGLGGVDPTVIVDAGINYRTVHARSSTDIDTIFMHMSGFDVLPAPAASTADEKVSNVEISLVLDISGSMRWNERMDRLRPAAKDFIDKVMDDNSVGVTTLNLIPFAGQVNPGDEMFDYFRGARPKIKNDNNGWGNGDQDAPGNSLCNNNAENAEEGAADPACADAPPAESGYFLAMDGTIDSIVVYFDTDGDDTYDRAHKIEGFAATDPRDVDAFYQGVVAYLLAQDGALLSPDQFLGISVKQGGNKQYYQVKGDENGYLSDLGPIKHNGKLPGETYRFADIDHVLWAAAYVAPVGAPETVNVNMPSSCVEIYDAEFLDTALPVSEDYIPHFHYWGFDEATMDWGWCPEDDTAIQYYSDDAGALKAYIDQIRLHDGTGAQYGMKYALALLDPATRDAVSYLISRGMINAAYEGRPRDWDDPETEKYVVMMTDGIVTEQVRPNNPTDPANGETELQILGGGAYHVQSQQSGNIENLYAQCSLARQNGVTVFTIAYETDSTAANVMKTCASSEGHFFHVTGNEIADAFDTIARQINNLRLTQ